jgi:hypothetical protein
MSNYIYAVSIDLDVPIYLTDFHRSIIHDSKNFISGEIDVQSSVTQKSQPSASDFNLTLSAVDQTLVNAFANNDYKNRRCLIERLTLDDDENVIESEIWLDGDCNKYAYSGKLNTSTLNLMVSSIFAAFDAVNMVNLNLKFAEYINADEVKYWGKEAPVISSNRETGDPRQIPVTIEQ